MVVVIFGLDGACNARHVGGILEFPGLSPGPFLPAIVAIYPCAYCIDISDLVVDIKLSLQFLLTVAANDEFLGASQAQLLARYGLFRDGWSVVLGSHVCVPLHFYLSRRICLSCTRRIPNSNKGQCSRLDYTQTREVLYLLSCHSTDRRDDSDQFDSTVHERIKAGTTKAWKPLRHYVSSPFPRRTTHGAHTCHSVGIHSRSTPPSHDVARGCSSQAMKDPTRARNDLREG